MGALLCQSTFGLFIDGRVCTIEMYFCDIFGELFDKISARCSLMQASLEWLQHARREFDLP